MTKEYYCLVSSLSEQSLEGEHKGFDALALREMIAVELSTQDSEALRLLYLFYDIENLIARLSEKQTHNALGYLSAEAITRALEGEQTSDQEESESLELSENESLPLGVTRILTALQQSDGVYEDELGSIDPTTGAERLLWEWYYGCCAASKNAFLREWFSFDNTLRNLCAAFTARSAGLPVGEQLVGHNEITTALSNSSSADFGLRAEIEYLDSVLALLESTDILEKEHRLDLIRWQKADELTTFDYFNINTLLSYLAKVNIIHRWVALDESRGEAMLKKLLEELSNKSLLEERGQQG